MSLRAGPGGVAELCPQTHPNALTRQQTPWSRIKPEGSMPSALFGYLRKRLFWLRCSDDIAIQPSKPPNPIAALDDVAFFHASQCRSADRQGRSGAVGARVSIP